jgi:hypothetical protein
MTRPQLPPPAAHVVAGGWPAATLDGDIGARYCQDFAAALTDRLDTLGWSFRRLERESGVSYRAVAQIVRGLAAPDLRTVARLEFALQTDLLPRRRRPVAGSNGGNQGS